MEYNAHWALGDAHQADGAFDRALAAYERALALNGNDPDLLQDHGSWILPILGRAEEGIEHTLRAMRLNPATPSAISAISPSTICSSAASPRRCTRSAAWRRRAHGRRLAESRPATLTTSAVPGEAVAADAAGNTVELAGVQHQTLAVEGATSSRPTPWPRTV